MAIQTPPPLPHAFHAARPPFILMGIVVAAITVVLRGGAMLSIESGNVAPAEAVVAKQISNVAYGAGAALAFGLIVLGIVDRVVFRLSARKRGLPAGYVLAGALALLVIGVALGAGSQVRSGNEVITPSNQTAAAMAQFVHDIEATGIKTREDYLNDLDTIGWTKLMDADRLRADRDLSQTEKMLSDAAQLVGKYAQESRGNLEKVPGLLHQLNVPEAAKAEFLAGWEPGYPAMLEKVNKVWAIEQRVVDHFRGIVRLLRDRSTWDIVNGQIVFQHQNDLDTFNQIMGKIQRDVSEQQQIQTSMQP